MQPVTFLFVYFKECTTFLFLDNKSTEREPLKLVLRVAK